MLNRESLQAFIKWANILGILSIVFGALAALGGIAAFLIGAIPGILMILAGLKLLKAKKSAEGLLAIEDPALQLESFNQLIDESTAFFKFQGIYYIVTIVLTIIGIIAWFAVIAAIVGSSQFY
ncbi:MAG: hypothetical protein A2Y23_11770 [Clostridiales bacterium GWB2_37_7]|nr:MAG: hypothetical protein A2Y23_11770 [Clostridiales bacterium GWB2_37_7]